MRVLALVGLLATGWAAEMNGSPSQVVVDMLENQGKKAAAEHKDEEIAMAKFQQWCTNTDEESEESIHAAGLEIEDTQSKIEEATAKIGVLTEKIEAHQGDIECWQGDEKAATAVRGIERSEFQATDKDLSESIDALTRALAVVKQQDHDTAQASLLQMSALPEAARNAITAMVQDDDDDLDNEYKKGMAVRGPEAEGYKFQSDKIVKMFEDLHKDFDGQREDLRKTEQESTHAYEMLMADVKDTIQNARTKISSETTRRAMKQETKAENEALNKKATESKAADTTFKAETQTTCKQKQEDFDERTRMYQEEVNSRNEALAVLKNGKMAAAAANTFLLQTSSRSDGDNEKAVAEFLEEKAAATKSPQLSALALRFAAGGPFDKIKKMIENMILKLTEQAGKEGEQKAWCDQELGTNKQDRTHQQSEIDRLSAFIESTTSDIARLGKEVAHHSKEVSDVREDMEQLTEMREKASLQNLKVEGQAKDGEQAIGQAIDILEGFMKRTLFLQIKIASRQHRVSKRVMAAAAAKGASIPPPPETTTAAYGGSERSAGIVGFLETIQADFARLEESTKAEEAKQQATYEEEMHRAKMDEQANTDDGDYKKRDQLEKSHELETAKGDLRDMNLLLRKSTMYFEKLKPPCVAPDVSHEDRMAARAAEIESLQEALAILTGQETTA